MSLRLKISLLGLVFLSASLLVWGLAQAMPSRQAAQPDPGLPASLALAPLPTQPEAASPDISLITSPAPSCVLPEVGTGDCLITWNYLYAYADPSYMITMTVEIDAEARARYQGFFQTYMYVPSELLSFQVTCGAPGEGGDPDFGRLHTYTLRGRDSASLKAANYGSVLCPADLRQTSLPMVWK